MFNYYRQELAERDKLKHEESQLSQQQRVVIKQRKDLQLVNNYEMRVLHFLKKMQQNPFLIYDSLYKRSRQRPRDNRRRWLNASAMHSLDSYP